MVSRRPRKRWRSLPKSSSWRRPKFWSVQHLAPSQKTTCVSFLSFALTPAAAATLARLCGSAAGTWTKTSRASAPSSPSRRRGQGRQSHLSSPEQLTARHFASKSMLPTDDAARACVPLHFGLCQAGGVSITEYRVSEDILEKQNKAAGCRLVVAKAPKIKPSRNFLENIGCGDGEAADGKEQQRISARRRPGLNLPKSKIANSNSQFFQYSNSNIHIHYTLHCPTKWPIANSHNSDIYPPPPPTTHDILQVQGTGGRGTFS